MNNTKMIWNIKILLLLTFFFHIFHSLYLEDDANNLLITSASHPHHFLLFVNPIALISVLSTEI